jgi:RHS repeat-associated protein
MQKIIFFTAFLVVLLRGVTTAQNPYESIGKPMPKGKILTLTNGKYPEVIENDTVVRIGSVMFNTVTGEVVAFLTKDTLHTEYSLEPDVVSRWLSPDPLAEKYLQWSPYVYTMNNPIRFIDPDGMQVSDWYKDGEGKMRYDKSVTNEKTAKEKGGDKAEYVGQEHHTKGADYYKDGTAFFSDVPKGIEHMTANTHKNGKAYKEQAGFFVKDGLVVGNDEKSTVGQSTDAMLNLVSQKDAKGDPTQAKAGGKTHSILAPVHTHPLAAGFVDPPSGPDVQSVKQLSKNDVGFVIGIKILMIYNSNNTYNSIPKTDFFTQTKQYGYDYTINFYINEGKKMK